MNNKIKEEILNKIGDVKNINKVREELDIMDSTEGFNGVNNLKLFYESYKRLIGKTGTKNEINSWTAFYLGMTSKEPDNKKEFLPKRRMFVRASCPDIDLDFGSDGRNKVIGHLKEKYGEEYVTNVGTHNCLKLKMCLTKIVKALDLANSFHKGDQAYTTDNSNLVREIIDTLPDSMKVYDEDEDGDGDVKKIETIEAAYNQFDNFRYYLDKYPQIREHAKVMEGLTSNAGTHASGLLISAVPIRELAACREAKGKDPLDPKGKKITIYSTQMSYKNAEKIGLIKFDILGISTLDVLEYCLKLIKQNYNIDLDLESLPVDDVKTYKLLQSGKLTGVFQMENFGMQNTVKSMAVSNFDEGANSIALYRPGPMANIPEYCDVKRGLKPIDYFHPSLEKYIKPYVDTTYGILVFQEQLMQICKSVSGFSETEGNMMIKAVGKKDLSLMKKYEEKFIHGAEKNNIPKEVSEKYWHQRIIPFADYGFNRAHSYSYFYLSYICAYLKANYTEEYFLAQLNINNERKEDDKIIEIIKDFKNFNLKLAPKSINNCDVEFKLISKKNPSEGKYDSIISPSIMVKGVGLKAAQELCRCKPYKSVAEIAQKTNSTLVTLDCIKGLLEANFFDTLKSKYKKENKKELSDENILHEFTQARIDQKKLASKGIDIMQEGIF